MPCWPQVPSKMFLGDYLPPGNLTRYVLQNSNKPGSYGLAIEKGTIVGDALNSAVWNAMWKSQGKVSGPEACFSASLGSVMLLLHAVLCIVHGIWSWHGLGRWSAGCFSFRQEMPPVACQQPPALRPALHQST